MESVAEPLIRWAGSKRKLMPWLVAFYERSPKNHYIEPFCGSACLFLKINPESAILSDLNKELIEAYQTIQYSPLKLHKKLQSIPNTKEHYYLIRDQNPENLTKIDRSARFIYLNRYSFNGIYRTNKKGEYNVPRGTHTGRIPSQEAFRSVALRFRGAEVCHDDFEVTINKASKNSFVYLDPPYVYSGRRDRGEYGIGSFGIGDLARLKLGLKQLNRIGAHFVLSYVDKPEIQFIKKEWNCVSIAVNRQIGGFDSRRNTISELLISNF